MQLWLLLQQRIFLREQFMVWISAMNIMATGNSMWSFANLALDDWL
jgi:hypothetical protein